eukprot:COSAG05_NODE_180_length_14817_cov_423.925262_21_plen_94_part_00
MEPLQNRLLVPLPFDSTNLQPVLLICDISLTALGLLLYSEIISENCDLKIVYLAALQVFWSDDRCPHEVMAVKEGGGPRLAITTWCHHIPSPL